MVCKHSPEHVVPYGEVRSLGGGDPEDQEAAAYRMGGVRRSVRWLLKKK